MNCSVEGCTRSAKEKGSARGFCSMHYQRWSRHGNPEKSKIDRQPRILGCLVDGCKNKHASKGYCQAHYIRFKKYGSATEYHQDFRKKVIWIENHADYSGDDCLKWPFGVSNHGRGVVSLYGRKMTAPRAMCILAHGEPPDQSYHASHSCGKGHEGCMNPRHLSWKTPKENEADKIAHGTLRKGTSINTNKLTEDQVREIRALRGVISGVAIAKRYGITAANVSSIQTRKNWAWLD